MKDISMSSRTGENLNSMSFLIPEENQNAYVVISINYVMILLEHNVSVSLSVLFSSAKVKTAPYSISYGFLYAFFK